MCSETITKWGLVLINIVFFLVGGVILALGIWLHVGDTSSATVLNNVPAFSSGLSLFKTASLVFILVGSISFIPALFGCCGACLKIRLFLVVYVIILALFLLAELGFVVAMAVKKDEVKSFVRNHANDTLSEYVQGLRFNSSSGEVVLPKSVTELAWDTVHIQLECCGLLGPANFKYDAPKFNGSYTVPDPAPVGMVTIVAKVPISCCFLKDKSKFPSKPDEIEFDFGKAVNAPECLVNTSSATTHQEGCEEALENWVDDQFLYIIIAGIIVVLLELIGMVCGIKLFRFVSDEKVV